MNEIVSFLEQNNHCTRFFGCATCGGIPGFNADLDDWIKIKSPNLLELCKNLFPSDLIPIKDWQIFLEQIINRIPITNEASSVFSCWRDNFGVYIEFDLFSLQFAPPGAFDITYDRDWIQKDIAFIVQNNIGQSIEPLIKYIGVNTFLFPELEDYLSLVDKKRKEEEQDREKRAQRYQEERKLKEDLLETERRKTENRLSEINDQFSMQPVARLIKTFDDSSIPLSIIPKEWAQISDEFFVGISSREITGLIDQLTKRIKKKERSCWKDLRSRLYRLRQVIYNKEMGYPK